MIFKNGTESPKSAAVIFPQNKPRFGASNMFNAIQNWILADEQDHTLPKKFSSLISERFLDKLSLFMESPSIPQIKIIQMYLHLYLWCEPSINFDFMSDTPKQFPE